VQASNKSRACRREAARLRCASQLESPTLFVHVRIVVGLPALSMGWKIK
jgi:hypothetical protein